MKEPGAGWFWKSARTGSAAELERRSGVRPAGKTARDFCSCYAEFNRLRSGCLAVVTLLGAGGGRRGAEQRA